MARRSTSTASFIAAIFLSATANAQTTWYVDIANCPGPGSGTQEDPFCKIQDGIDAATDGDECLVAPGTYSETINFNGKAISLRSSGGPDVTTIDANDSGSAVSCTSGEGQDTVLQGFTITGGDAVSGGGMRNIGSSPTVDNCRFVENEAAVGAGMYNENSNPTVTDCTFVGNSTFYGAGGGMANTYSSNPLLIDCVFRQNTGGLAGGGLQAIYSNVTAVNCKFIENSAERGGGMKTMYGSAMLVNCRFEGNTALFGGGMLDQSDNLMIINTIFTGNMADYGGGMYDGSDKNATVTNCTFVGNSANDNHGGAIRSSSAGTTTVTNCILWNNDGGSIGGISPTVTYSDIEGGFPGTGNIDAEPLFADPDNGDYQLSPGSPCIDAADNTAVPADISDLDGDADTAEPIPLDLDGSPRFIDDPNTEDTGMPDPKNLKLPIVDMGAFEFQAGCVDDADCEDDNACTTDECIDVFCVHTPIIPGVVCDDGNLCTMESCDPVAGCVNTPIDPAAVCDDGNLCTTESCDPVVGCVNTPNTEPCDDGNACTMNDSCDGAGSPGYCTGDEVVCDDSDECTIDSCDPVLGCSSILGDGFDCSTDEDCEAGFTCQACVCDDGQDPCADDDGDRWVTICHFPPGNPDNAHTIMVNANAVPAHVAHGDSCGSCEGDDGPQT